MNEPTELLDWAWTIIANASGGDWNTASPEWKNAASKWRDDYHKWLSQDRANRWSAFTVEELAALSVHSAYAVSGLATEIRTELARRAELEKIQ